MIFPISDEAERRLLAAIAHADMDVAWRRWWQVLLVDFSQFCDSKAANEFEAPYLRLSEDGRLPPMAIWPVKSATEPPSAITMKQLQSPFVASGDAKGTPRRPSVLYQAVKQTGAIDDWMCEKQKDGHRIIWLLQMTMGSSSSHAIKLRPLAFTIRALRRGRWANAEVRLAFVVPHWQAEAYSSKYQHFVYEGNKKITEREWKAKGKKTALAKMWHKYYSPGPAGQWVTARPAAELKDSNGLTAAPFTMREAMDTVHGSGCRLAQWVWSCRAEVDVVHRLGQPAVGGGWKGL